MILYLQEHLMWVSSSYSLMRGGRKMKTKTFILKGLKAHCYNFTYFYLIGFYIKKIDTHQLR